jgi:hypothetical protein
MKQIIKNLTSALAVMAIAAGSLVFGSAPANAVGGYYPSGPQLNVPISTITSAGWKLCWSGLYSDNTSTLASIKSSCSQKYLIEAAGQVGASNYLLAAAGERSAVFNTTPINGTTLNNGTHWYFNAESMGFSPNANIEQSAADIVASNAWDPADQLFRPYDGTEDYRLSWHTLGDNNISYGWRAGKVVWLNSTTDDGTYGVHASGSDYIRAIYQSDDPMPKKVAKIDSVSFVDDGTGAGGNLVWTGSFIEAVMFTGDEKIYPGAFNYGAFTSGWNGRLFNLQPGTKYTVSIRVVSVDNLGEEKSLSFTTPAVLPADPNAKSLVSSNQLGNIFAQIDRNTFYSYETSNMKNLLNKFTSLETSPHRSFIKVPTSRVSKWSAVSLTPKSCKAETNGVVLALNGETCTISYTVSGPSKAPVTLIKDFVFKKFNK